jgi:hypothetical protein
MLACQQKQESTNANLSSKNEELMHQYFEYFNQHDWKKMAAMYSDTAAFKDPTLGQDIVSQTHNDIIKKYSALQQTFADIHDEVQNVYPSGENNIIVEFISTGTAPDSTTFKLPICTIFTIENGLITKDFTYFDNFEE